jgi:uncharacterized YigZ family protein
VSVTLAASDKVRVESEIKKSRFIADLRRIDTTDASNRFLADIRTEFPDARHHCFAYVIGDEPTARIERAGDDGEPGGTAGIPMLQVLKARDLTNVTLIVTRYFGGVKLGAGGLARAYSGAAKAAVDAARLYPRVRYQTFHLGTEHAEAGRVEAELRGRGVDVVGVEYDTRAILELACTDATALQSTVDAVTLGRGELIPAGHFWA